MNKQEEAERIWIMSTRSKMRYLRSVPKVMPGGQALWHNFPPGRDLNRRIGDDGFRIFFLSDDAMRPQDESRRCACGWAPHIAVHYSGRNAVTRIKVV
jgi:hypothetical protein